MLLTVRLCLQGAAVKILPVEALSGGSTTAQMKQHMHGIAHAAMMQFHVKTKDGAAHIPSGALQAMNSWLQALGLCSCQLPAANECLFAYGLLAFVPAQAGLTSWTCL